MALENVERGTLRSGRRFAARNKPYYSSLKELHSHHPRLFHSSPAISSEVLRIGDGRQGNLIQTTIRFRSDYLHIQPVLRHVFLELFREHTESAIDGFEVVTVFNAILTDAQRTSFSVFYGHDYAYENTSGASSELKYSEVPTTVRSLLDVKNIPTNFDFENLIQTRRFGFEKSGVSIEKIINVIYLIRRLIVLPSIKTTLTVQTPTVENVVDSDILPSTAFEGEKKFTF